MNAADVVEFSFGVCDYEFGHFEFEGDEGDDGCEYAGADVFWVGGDDSCGEDGR